MKYLLTGLVIVLMYSKSYSQVPQQQATGTAPKEWILKMPNADYQAIKAVIEQAEKLISESNIGFKDANPVLINLQNTDLYLSQHTIPLATKDSLALPLVAHKPINN